MRRRWLALLVPVLAPWVVLALMGREIVPASIERTDRMFAWALPWTYAGLWLVAILAARPRRLMVLRAVGTHLVVALALVLLELPAAFRWIHWDILLRQVTGEGRDYGSAYVYDAELSFRRIPGLHWSGRPESDVEQGSGLPRTAEERITFTYDRWGYRNAVEMERADVVVLGDSYAEGWYVSDEQTVASRLGERLGRPVANLGVAGYGALQELRVLRHDGLARRPKVVVWLFFEGNDLYDDQHFENYLLAEPPSEAETTPHPEGLAASHGWRQRSFTLNALRRLRRWAHPLVPNRAPYWAHRPGDSAPGERIYFADYGAVRWTDYEASRWTVARGAIEKAVEVAANAGAWVLPVYVPTKYRVYRDAVVLPPDSPMRTWSAWAELPSLFSVLCQERGLACVDLTEPFQRAVRAGVDVYARTDTHWSSEGHDLAAREIETVMRQVR